jgi:hypothetical protein
MKGQYVIIDLRNMEVMKDYWGNPIYYTTEEEACETCGMYEFENAWVMQLIYNHIEKN